MRRSEERRLLRSEDCGLWGSEETEGGSRSAGERETWGSVIFIQKSSCGNNGHANK